MPSTPQGVYNSLQDETSHHWEQHAESACRSEPPESSVEPWPLQEHRGVCHTSENEIEVEGITEHKILFKITHKKTFS